MSTYNPSDQLTNAAKAQAVAGTVLDVTTDSKVLINGICATNLNAAVAYLQVFDKQSASVSLGTTTPDWYICLPASGNVCLELLKPVKHTTGCSIAVTTTATGSTAGSASVTVFYGSLA